MLSPELFYLYDWINVHKGQTPEERLAQSVSGLGANGTFTRSESANSSATIFNQQGLIELVGPDILRIDYYPAWDARVGTRRGFLAEAGTGGSRSNWVGHNRDATQSNWTKTLGTAAKDATGIDGVASSASSFTATSANAVLQESYFQSPSQGMVHSAYLRRRTGSGVVELGYNGVYTVVAPTNEWERYSIITAAGTSFDWQLRLTDSGDVIEVDFAQAERVELSSPILNTDTGTANVGVDDFDATQVSEIVAANVVFATSFEPANPGVGSNRNLIRHADSTLLRHFTMGHGATFLAYGQVWSSPINHFVESAAGIVGDENIAAMYALNPNTPFEGRLAVNGTLSTGDAAVNQPGLAFTVMDLGSFRGWYRWHRVYTGDFAADFDGGEDAAILALSNGEIEEILPGNPRKPKKPKVDKIKGNVGKEVNEAVAREIEDATQALIRDLNNFSGTVDALASKLNADAGVDDTSYAGTGERFLLSE